MLELKRIVKDYVSGNNVTHALKGISVNFRKSEFVSILGASGCGKTTTLNIIGGLDRYTKGDLKINGKSTKKYTDRDWDTYRNHSVGFIFQSYNLISHQNILKNVELALTISGINKQERRERAIKALETVGLKGMEKKKPNQLSGGQCQRVAIARALVNNPEILLADEPTGALDSETSVQIMNLLKEVAKDRLVIMVTHNPDLAKKYSTRIITMSDGVLLSDSNPFKGHIKPTKEVKKGNKKKSSMSIWTAAGLSMANLFSKLKRTILVTVAGSIGIIGVSAVLAVSQGVKDYIGDLQNDMLSSYPITIAEESVDYTSLMTGLSFEEKVDAVDYNPNDPKASIDSMIKYLMTTYSGITNFKTNAIDQTFMDFLSEMPNEYVEAKLLNYGIDPTNNIFTPWKNEEGEEEWVSFNGLTQRYIAELLTVDGFEKYASYVDLFTGFMKEMPDNPEYIADQYEVLKGNPFSLSENEMVLVVDKNVTITDLLLAETGLLDHTSFINLAKCAVEENRLKEDENYDSWDSETIKEKIDEIHSEYPYDSTISLDDILNKEFYYFPQDTIYSDYGKVADDQTTVTVSFMINDNDGNFERLVYGTFQEMMGFKVISGTTAYKEEDGYTTKSIICLGLGSESTDEVSEKSLDGTWYALDTTELLKSGITSMTFGEIVMYIMNNSLFSFTLNYENPSECIFNSSTPITPTYDKNTTSIDGYACECKAKDEWISSPNSYSGVPMKIGSVVRLREGKNFGCLSTGLYYSKTFSDKFIADSEDGKVTQALMEHMTNPSKANSEFPAYVKYRFVNYKLEDPENPDAIIYDEGYASSLNGDLSSSFSDLFSGLTGVNYQETNAVSLRALSGLKTITVDDRVENNTFEKLPKQIQLYPKDFESKDSLTNYLDKWNSDDTLIINGEEVTHDLRMSLTYTDTIKIIITLITTLINAVTAALVAFSSLSLVVSCFMIAVITYISVVERIKEIGVIRSLGGRKGDVANLFIMETLFTGLFSGVFGIAMTYLFQFIFNICLKNAFGIMIANLTPLTAIIMILVSITLSVVSGLIPSQSAARKDPVVALRSNE